MTEFLGVHSVHKACTARAPDVHRARVPRQGFLQHARRFDGVCNERSGKVWSGMRQVQHGRISLITVNNQASSHVRRAAGESCQQGVQ